jgi:hypothetical protein
LAGSGCSAVRSATTWPAGYHNGAIYSAPHASFLALAVAPQDAYANIARLRSLYPDIYTSDGGFYDAVNPSTGSVGTVAWCWTSR